MAESLGLAVAAWSPLAGGVLSGKVHPAAGQRAGHPHRPGQHHRPAAGGRAGGPGRRRRSRCDPSQVAIAWTRARSPVIHPIIGARRLTQLQDNLGTAQLDLPPEVLARLDAEAGIDLGFPATFIEDNTPWVFGVAALPADR